ncbi:cupin domain-containing protein [Leptothoe spongobia]|uniref:Cupin domain-containing protein n=1 Tax=Leptothoe spongobia TAU-MAC 1115 TaxID=1967444 RepID=A0A947GHB6_9CYAN|nr:cupin domain-containing protein [Leptothoe spongobia]MBT9314874.1 cupin domain-containing protein [Leptothoe spongobia TAU-MAC 1115]
MRFFASIPLLGLITSGMLSACSAISTVEQPSAIAQQSESSESSESTEKPTIVPQQERDNAQQLNAAGPTETSGIESLIMLGAIDLQSEFEALEGYTLRARELVITPGGQVAVHQHDNRPGLAYIIEGEMVEYRNDQDEPIVRSAGAVSFEKTGVVHWWKNESSNNARALVVDIVPETGPN